MLHWTARLSLRCAHLHSGKYWRHSCTRHPRGTLPLGKPGTLKGAGMAGPGSQRAATEMITCAQASIPPSLHPVPAATTTPSHPRPSTVLPNTGPAGVAVPPSGSRSTSQTPWRPAWKLRGWPLQVRTGIWNFSKRRDVQFPNEERTGKRRT